MNKEIIVVVFLLLVLMNTPNSLFNAQKVKGNATTIYIGADARARRALINWLFALAAVLLVIGILAIAVAIERK